MAGFAAIDANGRVFEQVRARSNAPYVWQPVPLDGLPDDDPEPERRPAMYIAREMPTAGLA